MPSPQVLWKPSQGLLRHSVQEATVWLRLHSDVFMASPPSLSRMFSFPTSSSRVRKFPGRCSRLLEENDWSCAFLYRSGSSPRLRSIAYMPTVDCAMKQMAEGNNSGRIPHREGLQPIGISQNARVERLLWTGLSYLDGLYFNWNTLSG